MIPIRDANPTGRPPFLTLVLIALNAGLFLLVWGEGPEAFQESIQTLGLIPALWIEEGFPLEPVLTSMFMHGGWAHLIGNMWYLWIFADNVEDKLGPWRFLLLYFLSGVGAVVFQVVSRLDSMIPIVGASGAISGVLGAYLVFFPQARVLALVAVILSHDFASRFIHWTVVSHSVFEWRLSEPCGKCGCGGRSVLGACRRVYSWVAIRPIMEIRRRGTRYPLSSLR
jgi:membrane associated rhomboid family serine protease